MYERLFRRSERAECVRLLREIASEWSGYLPRNPGEVVAEVADILASGEASNEGEGLPLFELVVEANGVFVRYEIAVSDYTAKEVALEHFRSLYVSEMEPHVGGYAEVGRAPSDSPPVVLWEMYYETRAMVRCIFDDLLRWKAVQLVFENVVLTDRVLESAVSSVPPSATPFPIEAKLFSRLDLADRFRYAESVIQRARLGKGVF